MLTLALRGGGGMGHDPAHDVCSADAGDRLQTVVGQRPLQSPTLVRDGHGGGTCDYRLPDGLIRLTVYNEPDVTAAVRQYALLKATASDADESLHAGDQSFSRPNGTFVMRRHANVLVVDPTGYRHPDGATLGLYVAAGLAECW
jgi:hypothetical protein